MHTLVETSGDMTVLKLIVNLLPVCLSVGCLARGSDTALGCVMALCVQASFDFLSPSQATGLFIVNRRNNKGKRDRYEGRDKGIVCCL